MCLMQGTSPLCGFLVDFPLEPQNWATLRSPAKSLTLVGQMETPLNTKSHQEKRNYPQNETHPNSHLNKNWRTKFRPEARKGADHGIVHLRSVAWSHSGEIYECFPNMTWESRLEKATLCPCWHCWFEKPQRVCQTNASVKRMGEVQPCLIKSDCATNKH